MNIFFSFVFNTVFSKWYCYGYKIIRPTHQIQWFPASPHICQMTSFCVYVIHLTRFYTNRIYVLCLYTRLTVHDFMMGYVIFEVEWYVFIYIFLSVNVCVTLYCVFNISMCARSFRLAWKATTMALNDRIEYIMRCSNVYQKNLILNIMFEIRILIS